MTQQSLSISDEYAWVILVAAAIGFQCLLQGFSIGGQRRKLFNKEFFTKNFPKLTPHPEGGYPDMGNGRYSEKLSLEQWTTFNNYQRVHYNYVEGVATAIILVLGSGIWTPRLTVIFGLVYIFGRVAYAIGYRSSGPSRRIVGAILIDISLLTLAVSLGYHAFHAGGGVKGFLRLVNIDDVIAKFK